MNRRVLTTIAALATVLLTTGGAGAAAAAAATGYVHTIDVIYIEAPDRAPVDESVIADAVQRLEDYWTTESEGLISRIYLGEVKRVPVPSGTAGQDVCSDDGARIRAWAADQMGRPIADYHQSQGEHLLIIESTTACGHTVAGNGRLGDGLDSGGSIWLKLDPSDPSRWNHVLFHEFGHNLGLGHSNELVCPGGRVDTAAIGADGTGYPDCTASEYGDAIDVMGRRFTAPGYTKEKYVAALNVTDRVRLGIFGDDDVRRVSESDGPVVAIDLLPSTDATGIRAVEITDPVTGQKYYLEYRAGQGRDAPAYYASSPADTAQATGLEPGVRVLRMQGAHESVVLNRPGLSDARAAISGDNSYVDGDVFLGYSERLRVEVGRLTPAGAALCVSFSAERPSLTATVPTVSGSGRIGDVLTAAAGPWQPATATTSYQWLRDGAVIAGADGPTYLPSAADLDAEISVRVTGAQECYDGASASSVPLLVTAAAGGDDDGAGAGDGTDPVPGNGGGTGPGSGAPGSGTPSADRDALAVTGGAMPVALLGGASALLLLGWLLQRRRRRA